MKSLILPVAVAAGLLSSAPLQAQEGPWMVRLRAVSLQPADKSDEIGRAHV